MAQSGEGESNGKRSNGGGSGGSGSETSASEWIVAALSAVLVLGAIGFMLYEAASEPASPPDIIIQVDSIVRTGTGYVVEFEARNRGQTTAAGLTISGELRSDTGTVATSDVTIDYVPADGTRRGGLFFSENPRLYRLEIRPEGYDRP